MLYILAFHNGNDGAFFFSFKARKVLPYSPIYR